MEDMKLLGRVVGSFASAKNLLTLYPSNRFRPLAVPIQIIPSLSWTTELTWFADRPSFSVRRKKVGSGKLWANALLVASRKPIWSQIPFNSGVVLINLIYSPMSICRSRPTIATDQASFFAVNQLLVNGTGSRANLGLA